MDAKHDIELYCYRSHDHFDSMIHVVRIQSDFILSQLRTPQDRDRKSRVLIGRVQVRVIRLAPTLPSRYLYHGQRR
jgi:hypothetical protein